MDEENLFTEGTEVDLTNLVSMNPSPNKSDRKRKSKVVDPLAVPALIIDDGDANMEQSPRENTDINEVL